MRDVEPGLIKQRLFVGIFCNAEIVREALVAGANPNAIDRHGTPVLLHCRPDANGLACLELLLAAGADANVCCDGIDAASTLPEDPELRLRWLRALMRHGFDANRVDSLGYTLLEAAARDRDQAALELMLQHGADPRGPRRQRRCTQPPAQRA